MNRLFLFSFITFLWIVSIFANEQKFSQNGVELTVSDEVPTIKGFVPFFVVAKNTTQEKKTINGEITLTAQSAAGVADPPPEKKGSCTVYLELGAGESASKIFQCKAQGHTAWHFKIIKVYNF